jgi:hypothetical protein
VLVPQPFPSNREDLVGRDQRPVAEVGGAAPVQVVHLGRDQRADLSFHVGQRSVADHVGPLVRLVEVAGRGSRTTVNDGGR